MAACWIRFNFRLFPPHPLFFTIFLLVYQAGLVTAALFMSELVLNVLDSRLSVPLSLIDPLAILSKCVHK